MIDISVQSRSTVTPVDLLLQDDPDVAMLLDTSETLQTLVVPAVNPFKVRFGVGYRRALGTRLGLADLTTFESDFWDDGDGGEAIVKTSISIVGPWSLELEKVKLLRQVGASLKAFYPHFR
jgi:trafficking protein particle complex subunit 11